MGYSETREGETVKRFTVSEANALLPWLSEHLPRLRHLAQRLHETAVEIEKIKAVGLRDDGVLIMAHDYRVAKRAFNELREQLESGVEEVRARGVEIKDLGSGLVDFPAVIDGEEVLLCWRLGEPEVAFYHGYRDGFRGRRPIPPETP
jgi:hypothetical protein